MKASDDCAHNTHSGASDERILFVIACLIAVPTSYADDKPRFDVQKLYEMCKGEDRTYCIAYIAGVMDMMGMAAAVSHVSKEPAAARMIGLCSDKFVSYGAAMKAFTNWADKHPEKWSEQMAFGVLEALKATWPCKESS